MIILSVQNIVKEFNGEALFTPVSFRVDQKERVALIGPNGTGKSTILKIIAGKEEASSGQVVIGKEYSIGYLSQEVIEDLNHTLYEEMELAFTHLKDMKSKMDVLCQKMAENPGDMSSVKSYSDLETKFMSLGGYDYEYKGQTMLNKFGFRKEDWGRKLTSFSGGERMKAAFLKLLLLSPDLLILDEPTNHLDIDTIEWLEDYLKGFPGSLLFVSHDRYFINALSTRILELDQHHVEEYKGNYDFYAKEKEERYTRQLALYKRQQEEAKKIQWFITFYMPKPRFASRAHDREKKLARLEDKMVAMPTKTRSHMAIGLNGETREGKRLIEAKDVSIGYDGKTLISSINFILFGGDHLAIMGANGSGKTTFLKCLMHQLNPLGGQLKFLSVLSIGYLKQDTLALSSPLSIYEYIKDRFPAMEDQEIYNHLGNYAFSYEDDQKIIDNLSGGERMRVVLAEMSLHDYGLLILDEPTNHLDMMTKEEFIQALNSYKGTLVIVTHDRYFADSVCSSLLYFTNRKSYFYKGRYSDFKAEVLDGEEKRLGEEEKALKAAKKAEEEEKEAKAEYIHQHQDKPRPRLAKNKVQERMAKLEKDMAQIQEDMNKEENYTDAEKMDALERQEQDNDKEYEDLMNMLLQYEELGE